MGSLIGEKFNILGIANDAYSASTAASEAREKSMLSADTLEAMAGRKDIEAGLALQDGSRKMAELAVENRLALSEKRTGYAASGVKVDSGSTTETLADRAAWNEYERQKIDYDSQLDSWGMQYDAALLRVEAANTRASAASPSGAVWDTVRDGLVKGLTK